MNSLSSLSRRCSFLISMFFLICCSNASIEKARDQQSIVGVWEYLEDDVLAEVSGMSFFSKKHFSFIVNFQANEKDSSNSHLAHSGSYELRDSLVTATIKHSHNPAFIGHSIRWIHRVKNDTASYKVLDKLGNVVEQGYVRRLE